METSRIRIAVIGAGLGGLVAAVALRRIAGLDVTVYEQASELGEVGAGVGLAPNGQRGLDRLGLLEQIKRVGAHTEGPGTYLNSSGDRVADIAWGDSAGLYKNFGVHRADLIDVLSSAVPSARVHVGHKLISARQSEANVELRFENGVSAQVDAVVGADGVHSTVRDSILQPSDPVYSGCIAYRGTLDSGILPEGWPMERQVWMGEGKHFMCYPLRRRELLNYVGFVPRRESLEESWSAEGDVAELAAEFAGEQWDPRLQELIGLIDQTFWWGLFDREPLLNWSRGRVTLLGDAAHAMLPHVGQGVNQAIEDAISLAILLEKVESREGVVRAFKQYASVRMQRAALLQASSRRTGAQLDSEAEFEDISRRDAEVRAGRDFRSSFVFDYDAALVAERMLARLQQGEGGVFA